MADPIERCHELLPGVSRTFALLIPELPAPLRDEVACAYLLCRLADTIEDAADVVLATRLKAFDAMAAAMGTASRAAPLAALQALAADWSLDADHRDLVQDAPAVFAAFDQFAPTDRAIIADCVLEMIGGMRETVQQQAEHGAAAGLRDVEALERYCYYVAGVVGRMLTRLFWRTVHGDATAPPEELVARGVEFGLGLQLTNVLKDHRADLRRGVSYLPAALAASMDVDPGALRADSLPPAVRQVLVGYTARRLDVAMGYALEWPPTAMGIRTFCFGALFMAVRTLVVVLTARTLDATEAPKITRQDVTEIMTRARTDGGNDAIMRSWYADERGRLEAALGDAPPPA